MCAIAAKPSAQGFTHNNWADLIAWTKKSAADEAAPRFGDFSLNAKVYFSRNVV